MELQDSEFRQYTFQWHESFRETYGLPMEFNALKNKKFTLGVGELTEKTIALTVAGFHHDTISFLDRIIARCKFIKESPLEIQLQLYLTKENEYSVILGVVFCNLKKEPTENKTNSDATDFETTNIETTKLPSNHVTKLNIDNLVYYRFDKKQIAYFEGGHLMYEFAGTKFRTTEHCPAITFDYGLIEYSIPMIKILPTGQPGSSMYAVTHPAETSNREYVLPVASQKNMLQYMIDADFRELYRQWFHPTPKCNMCGPKKQNEIEIQNEVPACIHMTLCIDCVKRLAKIQLDKSKYDKTNSENNGRCHDAHSC